MENSFIYSKYISFLTGWTRSAGSLSLSMRHCQVDPGAFTVPCVSHPFFPSLSLSHTRRHVGPGHQPLTAYPQSLPVRLLCYGHRCQFRPAPRQGPPVRSHRATPPLPRCRTAVGARCAPPSRDGRLHRRALRLSVVPRRRNGRRSLRANPCTGWLPRLGIVGLLLPLPSTCTRCSA
jgi:hypothetical protein